MKQKKMLALTLSQLKQTYFKEFPELEEIALNSRTIADFKSKLDQFADSRSSVNKQVSEQIRLLIQHDGQTVRELSTGTNIPINTIGQLYQFLTGNLDNKEIETDAFIDLYVLFKQLNQSTDPLLSSQEIQDYASRWTNGLEKAVMNARKENKERMLHLLIQKIDNRKSRHSSRFHFDSELSYEEKYRLVSEWWNDFRFHLSMAIKSPTELNLFLNHSLSAETLELLHLAQEKGMPFFATPYYLSLLNVNSEGYNDDAIRSYILYSRPLVETYGAIRAWEKEDLVECGKPNAAGWILPEGNNIHRRYPEVAILIPDTMGRACGGLCASCQRMYDFQSKRLNFEFDALRPKENWERKLHRLMTYFEEDSQLRDILITGGDALMSQNKTLRNILDTVYQMAVRKREANKKRAEGEKYAELQRVRLGSRLLAYLPLRINDELVEILREFRQKASAVGVQQFIIQTHFQSPLEVTPEAQMAIQKILSSGWLITNQLVYTVAASRRGHTVSLRHLLNSLGVLCYYTFSVKGFEENYEVFTPISRSLQEQHEEKIIGQMNTDQAKELYNLLKPEMFDQSDPKGNTATRIREFMKKHQLPFLATDRSVLNLPAIGKSMTFKMVGLTPDGKRILQFDHDHTRVHSPIIHQMGRIYIVENKSLAAYLRQLEQINENLEEYATIWKYTQGVTEPRFGLYAYPDFSFQTTKDMSNLALTSNVS